MLAVKTSCFHRQSIMTRTNLKLLMYCTVCAFCTVRAHDIRYIVPYRIFRFKAIFLKVLFISKDTQLAWCQTQKMGLFGTETSNEIKATRFGF